MPESVRHRGVSRLEGFSDAVFGFALTLLVVSLETPRTTADLRALLGGFVPFAVMFAMVCWIWYEHNVFFRRYGLGDAWTTFLNSVLLFVVLFYVYPLRFLAVALIGQFFMPAAAVPQVMAVDGRLIMFMYSSGVLLIFGTFVMLHRHAWRQRASLGLDETELSSLRFGMRSQLLSTGIAVASILLLFAIPRDSQYAGWIYFLMGPLHAWNGYSARAAKDEIRKRASAPPEEPKRQDETHREPDAEGDQLTWE
jgi:uncharacterized membrane protein